MADVPLRVLFLEENETDLERICGELRLAGYAPQVRKIFNEKQLHEALAERDWDIFIAGMFSPELGGLTSLRIVRAKSDEQPFVFISDSHSFDIEEAFRLGANDYVLRSNLSRIGLVVRREIAVRRIRVARAAGEVALAEFDKKLTFAASLLTASAELTNDGLVMCNADGKIVFFNKSFLQLTTLPESDVFDATWSDVAKKICTKLNDASLWEGLKQTPQKKKSDFKIIEFGSRLLEVRVVPCLIDGKYAGNTWRFADVTERERASEQYRRLEQRLNQSQKLEALGVLAGGIAHDFNNLLAIMLNNAELVRAGTNGNMQVGRNLDNLTGALNQASGLVRQLLQYSRRDLQLEFSTQNFLDKLPAIVNKVREELATDFPFVSLNCEIENALPEIVGDFDRIRQIIKNLCLNAAQAARGASGKIVIRAARAEISPEDEKNEEGIKPGLYVKLTVSDDGVGIPPEALARLFEPFFTTKPPGAGGTGLGLGLPVVYGIVRTHGGMIHAESTPGHGSVFSIYFPAKIQTPVTGEVPEKRRETGPAISCKGAGQRIMVVDDDEAIASVTAEILGMSGFNAISFTEPRKALEAFRNNPQMADLMLADVNMPDIDGVVLAKSILEIRPGFPVLLLSGYSGPWTAETVRAIGISNMLSKPLPAKALCEEILKALREQKK